MRKATFLASFLLKEEIVVTTLSGCVPAIGDPLSSEVSVKIENWPSGQSGQIRFQTLPSRIVLAQRNVEANGNTVFNLLTPNENQLTPLSPSLPANCTGSINASPSGAKTTGLVLIFAHFGNSNTPLGQVILANQTPSQAATFPSKQGDKIGYFLFVDCDVNITGTYSCQASSLTSINVSYKRGWNYVITTIATSSGNTPTRLETTFHTTAPSDLRWYYTLGSVSILTPQGIR